MQNISFFKLNNWIRKPQEIPQWLSNDKIYCWAKKVGLVSGNFTFIFTWIPKLSSEKDLSKDEIYKNMKDSSEEIAKKEFIMIKIEQEEEEKARRKRAK